ncbi:hypothetical protein GCM10010488_20720 [Oerskovia jenensis]
MAASVGPSVGVRVLSDDPWSTAPLSAMVRDSRSRTGHGQPRTLPLVPRTAPDPKLVRQLVLV